MSASAHGSRAELHFERDEGFHTPQQHDQPGLFRSHPD
jgi:hypothetical protein